MAFVGLQVESAEFHGFRKPFDAGAESFDVEAAAFFCAEQDLRGEGVAVEPEVGKTGIDGGEIDVVAVKIRILHGIGCLDMLERAVFYADARGGQVPAGGVQAKV